MLKKLFKYDMKYMSRIVFPIYLALFAVTGLFCFSIYLATMWAPGAFMMTGTMLLYFLTLAATCIAPMILIAVRIYTNLYGDEGYLMHTLPVRPSSHIWSKCWTQIVFTVLSVIVVLISLFLVLLSSLAIFKIPFSEIFNQVQVWWNFFKSEILMVIPVQQVVLLAVVYALIIIVAPFYSSFVIFSSCSIGQKAKKYKVLASFGAYLGITFAASVISEIISWISILLNVNAMASENVFGIMFMPLTCQLMIYIALAIGGYFFTKRTMERNLNLE